LLAAALGYKHVDSGAMYRVVGLAAREAGVDPADSTALSVLLDGLDFDLSEEHGRARVVLAGRDVTGEIREPAIGEWASRVAAVPAVRARLVERQRKLAKDGAVVMEGRDIGTVVFPDADCKFFVTASRSERARRRQRDLRQAGTCTSLTATRAKIEERDRRDRERACAPLRPAADAVTIDTTALTPGAAVERMLEVVGARARP
jgi:cytidylate kinase